MKLEDMFEKSAEIFRLKKQKSRDMRISKFLETDQANIYMGYLHDRLIFSVKQDVQVEFCENSLLVFQKFPHVSKELIFENFGKRSEKLLGFELSIILGHL